MQKVAVIGGSGYTGLELIRLIGAHPRLTLNYVTSERYATKKVNEIFPSLSLTSPLLFQALNLTEALSSAEVFFLCLPHGISHTIVPTLLKEGKKVIDLSADYRLKDPSVYTKTYGKSHTDTTTLAEAVYGLPEIHRSDIAKTSLIANPGCYATSIILGLAPVLKADIMDSSSTIIADSKSGISGAGRKAETTYLYTECDQNITPYNIGKHRHVPEIEQEINSFSLHNHSLLFTPQLVPLRRGIISCLYVPLTKNPSLKKIWEIYHHFYQDEPFTFLNPLGTVPCLKDVYLSNLCRIGLFYDTRTKILVIISVLDNLIKGAAGQAIQNLNLMLGYDEKAGLPIASPFP